MNEYEKEGRKKFASTGRLFGLGAFLDCWKVHVVPLMEALSRKDERILSLNKEVLRLKHELTLKGFAVDALRTELRNEREKRDKEQDAAEYVVEQYDPSRLVFETYSRSFPTKDSALQAYQAIKHNEGPLSHEAELTLYKKVVLKKVKAKKYVLPTE